MKSQYWFPWLSFNLVYLLLTLILLSVNSNGSEWNIKCRFNKNGRNTFSTGKIISGFVDFVNTDHADLILERINAELTGEFVYNVAKQVNKSESKNTSQIRFFNERIVVHPNGTTGKFPVPYGSHSWPFRFELPDSLPPSLSKNESNTAFIHYFIRIIFVRSEWYKQNVERIFPIILKSWLKPQNATKIEKEGKSRLGVRLRVILPKNVVVAGDNLSFDIDLHNPKQNFVRRISMIFIKNVEFGSNDSKEFYLVKRDLEKIQKFKGIHFNESYQLQVPHTAPASFSFHLPSKFNKQSLSIRYSLYFQVHLRGLFTNIRLSLPVIVTNTIPKTND